MASVAICPHCYLQLMIPDDVAADERVECPTCAKQFGLDQAVLRKIPAVVRHVDNVTPAREATASAEPEATTHAALMAQANENEIDELTLTQEIDDELVLDAPEEESEFIRQIKAKIESELASERLTPGSDAVLPIDTPAADIGDALDEPAAASEPFDALFRQAKTVPEIAPIEVEIDDELLDLPSSKPTVRTLADLMSADAAVPEPPSDENAEPEVFPGPSFELPNVPLTPDHGATLEIDPSLLGHAAETEFQLEDIDFDSSQRDSGRDETASEWAAADDDRFASEEEASPPESASELTIGRHEPVFHEPTAEATAADVEFVVPQPARPRRQRSVVRTLVGTALGGVVGLSLGYFILLHLLGPEGDLLHIAGYLPSAVLPSSFERNPGILATSTPPSKLPERPIAAPEEEPAPAAENIPASYVETAPADTDAPLAEEPLTAAEETTAPAPLEEPVAAPIAAAAVLPVDGPNITLNQLAVALETAKEAQPGLTEGDLTDKSTRQSKGRSYAKLCDLAEAVTFLDQSLPSVERNDALRGADELYRSTLADARVRDEVARIAPIWIDSPHRSHSGFFTAGTTSGGEIAGDGIYEYELTTASGQLVLLTHEPLDPAAEGGSVAVVGAIVDDATKQVKGYQGKAQRAIWVSRAIPLD